MARSRDLNSLVLAVEEKTKTTLIVAMLIDPLTLPASVQADLQDLSEKYDWFSPRHALDYQAKHWPMSADEKAKFCEVQGTNPRTNGKQRKKNNNRAGDGAMGGTRRAKKYHLKK